MTVNEARRAAKGPQEQLENVPKLKVYNSLSAHMRPKNYKVNDEPSMTVPEQSMTVREIMNRHVRGIPTSGNDPDSAVFDPDAIGVDLRKLDLAEIEDIKRENAQTIVEKQNQLSEMGRKKAHDAKQLDIETEVSKRLNEAKNEPEKPTTH